MPRRRTEADARHEGLTRPHDAALPLSWAVRTDPGLRRSSNEDSYCTRVRTSACSSSPTAWAATSPARSPRASRSKRSQPSSRRPPAPTRTAPGRSRSNPTLSLEANRLKAAFRLANRRIAAAIADSQDLRGMATTASAVLLGPTSACVAHVGDSRVYVLRDGDARRRSPTITRGSKSRCAPAR